MISMFRSRTQSGHLIEIPYSFHGFSIIQFLNSGFCSIVVKVRDLSTHQYFAAKIIPKKVMEKDNGIEMIHKEIQIHQSLNHPNIVKMYDSFEIKNEYNNEYIVMIMEYCLNGDLFDYASQIGFRNGVEKKKIMINFLKAIEYLHNNGISHGDIKPENILLDENLNPKLCDFGFSNTSIFSSDQKINYTIFYAAPELLKRGEINLLKADIWAIGITLYCLSELSFPFPPGDEQFISEEILSGSLTISTEEKLQFLIEKCTQMHPNCRPKIQEILEDEFFQS